MIFCSLLNAKVRGCSGNSFRESVRIRAGMATLPCSITFSIGMVVCKVVSRSEAVMVRESPVRLNRKLSSMGNVFLEAITLLTDCSLPNNSELDTTNFIGQYFILQIY